MPTAPGIRVRIATDEDAETIVEFNEALALESEGRKLNHELVRDGVVLALKKTEACSYFVAEVKGQLVAQTMVTYEWSDWRCGNFWWIQSVYVHPDFRKRGIFKTIYQHIEESAMASGNACGLRLYVEEKNVGGIETYEHVGMTRTDYFLYELDWSKSAQPSTGSK